MLKLLVIHGPNLSLLGKREPTIYGTLTLEEINNKIKRWAELNKCDVCIRQYDSEGDIVGAIGKSDYNALVINPAAYTHTSIAIADALRAVNKPAVEVHLSNIHNREEWRKRSYIAPVVHGQISGLGVNGYLLALDYLMDSYLNRE